MDNETLVQLITAEILRQLKQSDTMVQRESFNPLYKALVIFTGGTIGLEQSLKELRRIQAFHTEFTVVLSQAAEEIVGINRIKENLGNHIPIITAQSPYPGKMLRDVDLVLVPVLTQNTASKLAYTLSDTIVSTLILQALMLGKPVIAVSDAADPQDGWRVQRSMMKATPALLQALRDNLQKIEMYGVRLVSAAHLAAEVKKVWNSEDKVQTTEIPVKQTFIDARAIEDAVCNGAKIITVAKGSIVTPLARDVAREYDLEIVQVSP